MTNFKELSQQEKEVFAKAMFQPLESALELKHWIHAYFGLDMPYGHVDPDSNSSPVEAMWEIYNTIKENKGEENPGYIMLSAREGYKTLSSSILEALLMLHFQLTIAHMAAIKDQSAKSISYINYFFGKIEPLLEVSGWQNKSQNKTKVEYRTPEGEDVYIQVVVATMTGANSAHTNLMFVDEIDVVKDPQAYEEAKLIPGYAKGIHPVTIKLSTRKFAFGMMQKEIDLAPISGDKILRWNIIDVTEQCPPDRHLPDLPREDRYVSRSLPLQQLSTEEYQALTPAEQEKFEYIHQAYAGCAGCQLLAVCKTRLATRDPSHVRGLYKPVGAVINTFRKTNPDMAEAQLMCWKPSAKGMVYPRFDGTINSGNVITLDKAWETLIGPVVKKTSHIDLVAAMRTAGILFYAGVDWGYAHDFVIVIFALIPNGDIWITDCFSAPGLEFSDQLEVAKSYRDKYNVQRWFADTAMPSSIKSFNKNGMKCAKFVKDIMGGVESLRSKILDSTGRRYLKILFTDANQKIINSFMKHHFKLGSDGNPTIIPDDTPGVSDQADAMRYVGQNLFPIKGTQKPAATWTEAQNLVNNSNPTATEQMRQEVASRVAQGVAKGGTGKKGGFFWDI